MQPPGTGPWRPSRAKETAMLNLQSWDWIVIFLIVLLIFGGRKIPELARSLGKGVREFRKAKDGVEESLARDADAAQPAKGDAQDKPGA
jgi:sec-independent protein translocase protein TatA